MPNAGAAGNGQIPDRPVAWGIGVNALLNALGLPEEIVAATIDHDQPRPALSTVRSLTDVVYVIISWRKALRMAIPGCARP